MERCAVFHLLGATRTRAVQAWRHTHAWTDYETIGLWAQTCGRPPPLLPCTVARHPDWKGHKEVQDDHKGRSRFSLCSMCFHLPSFFTFFVISLSLFVVVLRLFVVVMYLCGHSVSPCSCLNHSTVVLWLFVVQSFLFAMDSFLSGNFESHCSQSVIVLHLFGVLLPLLVVVCVSL